MSERFCFKIRCRACETARWVKELAAKPAVPRPYMVEGGTSSLKLLTWVRDREILGVGADEGHE